MWRGSDASAEGTPAGARLDHGAPAQADQQQADQQQSDQQQTEQPDDAGDR